MNELRPKRIPPAFFGERQDTAVTWLGMAGVLVNARGTILLVDPLIAVTGIAPGGQQVVESGNRLKVALPIEVEQVVKVDAVLYTHADFDHFGRVTAKTLAERLSPPFLAPLSVCRLLGELGIGQDKLLVAEDWASVRIGEVEVVVTPALHDWQEENPWQRGDCCGFLIKTPDGVIWHPGDTQLIDELLDVRGVDVLFFDVAAVDAHLGPAGSARLAETSGAKVMVAYHYGTFDLPPGSYGGCDPEDARPYIEGLPARFLLLNPGEVLRLPLEAGVD